MDRIYSIDFTDCKDYFGGMTNNEEDSKQKQNVLNNIKSAIGQLPTTQMKACLELYECMTKMVETAGEPVGTLALALVGAEAQAKGVR